ncbi:Outer membrane protein assembly factor BamB, contains PQQ-like beta-propeller repeat [Fontibacillus panacisegetis]|uniref:Outer membrane protein assembly factor BamB, contains PQQ-like beta-propeller repeat n=1 Tax=Fontibacillus panacisegetis TaxID=670482 RepID=A0A1G7L7Q1_9BACL|nr:PQQ-binding-like beta-propeller repeat protein [Fontibacillus panacisegetis]SDF45498.1 Outer membrane protein assembly factor BamB, contains PQQ-like beta-propeller repeat [Fontibacillus panacisegetis]
MSMKQWFSKNSMGFSQRNQSDASMFRGNLKHTGWYDTEGPREFHQVKWRFQTNDRIRSSPVIAKQTVYFGSDDHNFYAVNTITGELKWSYQTEGAIKSSAAIANETVYFLSGDEKLYALNADDGALKWSYMTEEKDDPRDPVDYWQSSPAVADGIVYFGAGEGSFYALYADHGELVWKKKLSLCGYENEGLVPILHSSPAVDEGVIYMGLSGYDLSAQKEPGHVVALDAKSGEQIWMSPLVSAVDGSVVVDDYTLYFGTRNGGLYAIDKRTGQVVWHSDIAPYLLGSLALVGDTLFSGSSDSHMFVSLDKATGEKKWMFPTLDAIHASPSTDGRTVYFALGNHYTEENHGLIYAVDAETGGQLWTYQTEGNIYSSPALDHGVVIIGSDDGYLYAIE